MLFRSGGAGVPRGRDFLLWGVGRAMGRRAILCSASAGKVVHLAYFGEILVPDAPGGTPSGRVKTVIS